MPNLISTTNGNAVAGQIAQMQQAQPQWSAPPSPSATSGSATQAPYTPPPPFDDSLQGSPAYVATAPAPTDSGSADSTSGAASTDEPTAAQLAVLKALIKAGLAPPDVDQVGLNPKEARLYRTLVATAANVDALYSGVDDSYSMKQNNDIIAKNIKIELTQFTKLANHAYAGNQDKVIMAQNDFLLASYANMAEFNPDFEWPKLGIFAANEVRQQLALMISMKEALRTSPGNTIAGMTPAAAIVVLNGAEHELINGQLDVLANLGPLVLLDKRYGAAVMSQQSWLSSDAKEAFRWQALAESAKASGNLSEFHHDQERAATYFTYHEQTNVLQAMYDKPIIHTLMKINAWMLQRTGMGITANLYIGVNKTDGSPGYTIKPPPGMTDLTNLDQRKSIVRNGFEQLSKILYDPQPINGSTTEQRQDDLDFDLSVFRQGGFEGRGLYQPNYTPKWLKWI